MKLPDSINFKIKGFPGANLKNIVFTFEIKSGTKNSYHIKTLKTDSNGEVSISKSEIIEQFEDHHVFLMDYNGTIESASPIIEVKKFNPEGLLKNKKSILSFPISKFEKSKWKSRMKKFKYYTERLNKRVNFRPINHYIEKNNTIIIKINDKKIAA